MVNDVEEKLTGSINCIISGVKILEEEKQSLNDIVAKCSTLQSEIYDAFNEVTHHALSLRFCFYKKKINDIQVRFKIPSSEATSQAVPGSVVDPKDAIKGFLKS